MEAEKIEAEGWRLWTRLADLEQDGLSHASAAEVARGSHFTQANRERALSALVRSEVSRAAADIVLGIATHRDRWQEEAQAQDRKYPDGGRLTWQRAYAAQVIVRPIIKHYHGHRDKLIEALDRIAGKEGK